MTTSAVSNVLAQTTNAQFQAWVTEVVTALFTTLGVTQTADTGQINPATATIPSVNTSAGYVIGRFNDTLQSTAPVFFKLEFGSGATTTEPMMWLTVGTGSNGSGTITNGGGGAITTRVAVLAGSVISSTSTSFPSRYCYLNSTQAGILWVGFKYGAISAPSAFGAYGGFVIMRTNDANGNATANGIAVITTAPNASGPGNVATNGYMQIISFANASVIPATPSNGWNSIPSTGNQFILGLTATLEGSTAFVAPVYTCDPVIRYSAYCAAAMLADFALATTSSFAIIGATPMTFISAGIPLGSVLGFDVNGSASTRTIVLPWQ